MLVVLLMIMMFNHVFVACQTAVLLLSVLVVLLLFQFSLWMLCNREEVKIRENQETAGTKTAVDLLLVLHVWDDPPVPTHTQYFWRCL